MLALTNFLIKNIIVWKVLPKYYQTSFASLLICTIPTTIASCLRL